MWLRMHATGFPELALYLLSAGLNQQPEILQKLVLSIAETD